ncbi:MAG: hypothetical protein L0Y54_22230 [Sporichthyaceae bacterium]|nr:hypothetical protein [Sporichthyaceae bacterium]
MSMLDAYLVAMVRRAAPVGAPVVPGSTPVVGFGDPRRAEVATLGINPSRVEFVGNGSLLSGSARRLATLESLGADDLMMLSDAQVAEVVADCARYFGPGRNPYRRWFDPLDRLLAAGVGASFYDGSACHLDLVQWATDPVWGEIGDAAVRRALLADGLPHLRAQLQQENIRLVLLNGRTVLDQVRATGLATLTKTGTLPLAASTCSLYTGIGEGVRFLGWSTNLQSSRGVTGAFATELAAWLAGQAGDLETTTPTGPPVPLPDGAEPPLDSGGHLVRGVTVRGKAALAELLARWLAASHAATIGDVQGYGGTPWVRIELGELTAVLNADTKRVAVIDYLDRVRLRGSDLPWRVKANRRGRVNKVTYAGDGQLTPGWFCYLAEPLPGPREL